MSGPEPTLSAAIREGFAAWAPSAQPTRARRRLLTAVYLIALASLLIHGVWFATR